MMVLNVLKFLELIMSSLFNFFNKLIFRFSVLRTFRLIIISAISLLINGTFYVFEYDL